jgi:hypothetical protein
MKLLSWGPEHLVTSCTTKTEGAALKSCDAREGEQLCSWLWE